MSRKLGSLSLAKLATIFAVGFAISLGLCGVNFLIVMGIDGSGGSNASGALFVTAYLELAGMAICAAGLLIVGLIAVSQAIFRLFANSPTTPKEDQ